MRSASLSPALLALLLAACGGDAGKTTAGAPAADKPAGGPATPDPAATPAPAATPDAPAPGADAPAVAADPPAGDPPADSAPAAAAGEAPAAEAPADPAAAITTLLDEAKAKKTKDDRARKALEEAEAAGAALDALAKAANARGEALFGEGDRAIPFFEWARDKDPKYADPSFNLAKMSAMQGDIDGAVTHLTEVKKRGGKKLLKTVGFDPTFEVVKDDPKVQELIK